MVFLNDNLVYRVVVIKGYKSKASLFATASVSHDFSHFSFPILFKIISQFTFFSVFFSAPTKIFFTVKWAPGLENLLLTRPSLVPQLFCPPCVALHSWPPPPPPPWHYVTNLKPLEHLVFGSLITTHTVCEHAPHYQTVCERSPLLRMAPQTLNSCFKAQSSDEELPQLFRLFGRL